MEVHKYTNGTSVNAIQFKSMVTIIIIIIIVMTDCSFIYSLYRIVFIHFHSASHSMSLSQALTTTAIDTVMEFTRRSATGDCK